jgi:predicted DNA-binding ribbon-helix-helix protein
MPDKAVHRRERYVARRTTIVSGRKTSITLEDALWHALREIAVAQDTTRAELVRKINQTRSNANLGYTLEG